MTNNTSENLALAEMLDEAKKRLAEVSPEESCLRELALEFSRISDWAEENSLLEVFRGADLFCRVLELAACWCSQFGDDPELVVELIGFVDTHMLRLETVAKSGQDNGEIEEFVCLAEEKWSDYLTLLGENALPRHAWSLADEEIDEDPFSATNEEHENIPESHIEELLAAVFEPSHGSIELEAGATRTSSENETAAKQTSDDASQQSTDEIAKQELANDREMLEAYLDDALRCLSSMEQAALAVEASPETKEAIDQFCRELHTLKGASATVGLSGLASYLHELESSLQSTFEGEETEVKAEPLFDAVDRVRAEIGSLQQNKIGAVDPGASETQLEGSPEISPRNSEFAPFTVNDDSSIRVRAAKLDRLMDMLAELVVLRNRRESHGAEFNDFNEELARCASRLSFAEEQSQFQVSSEPGNSNPFVRNSSCTFSEVAKDIAAVSSGLRGLQKPVSLDNAAISRFIRDFRQELMQLRRIPVSGLFRRLQRAARDAAKSENKHVQVEVAGEDAGLEQEIQERLFESLLHVVRNSVSHGIESAEQRLKAGKNPSGTITLEASSNAQLLIMEVRDDGNGLDYDSIRRRGIEKGLLSPNDRPSNAELATLVFHPGFSTRVQASAVSGRGVGMDIVAKTIEKLRGRVDVDSVAGQGTTIRMSIPLRTGIEHVMVFRANGQLFALPMQSVTAAKSANTNIGEVARLSWSSAISRSRNINSGLEDVLLLRRATGHGDCNSGGDLSTNTQVALAVDELIGPEEVVVRGLPNLLKQHPLFCGVTLSGSGEKVLLLNSERVSEFCQEYQSEDADGKNETGHRCPNKSTNKKRALVVDDSLTARRILVKILHQHDFVAVEAGDGIEAIERLHKEQFDLVLTDLDMPRFGGLELLADIQSSKYCDSPVVVVSSRNEEAFRTKAMDVGAFDYMTKPVSELSITQLLEKLQLLPETSKG